MTQNLSIPTLESVRQELGRRKLEHFTTYLDEKYTVNWHHRKYAAVLDKFINGEIKRLIVQMPPQHGKSRLCSINMPAMILGLNPTKKIAISSYNHDFTAGFNRAVQRVIDSDEYKELFPNTSLNSKNVVTSESWLRNATEFEVVGNIGGMRSVGVGGSLTGKQVDISIVDDPYKDASDAFSNAYETTLRNWWDMVLTTRLHNDSQICLTLTRWKDDDIVDYITNKEGEEPWTIIRFEAIKETDTEGDDREIGDALWPDRHELKKLEAIRTNTPSVFQAMYQGRPSKKGGNIILDKHFGRYEFGDLPKGTVHCYIDTAVSGKEQSNNDPTGILFFQTYQNNIYLIYFEKGHWKFNEVIEKIKALGGYYFNNQSKIYIENKSNGPSVAQNLKLTTQFNVMLDNVKGDKMARVQLSLPMLESGRVLIPQNDAWVKPFIEQCGNFPNVKNDEEIDTLTGAMKVGLEKKEFIWT